MKATSNNINNKQKNKSKKTSKLKTKLVKWTSALALLVGISVLFLLSPIFNIKQISVEGIQHLSSEEIISLSNVKLDENTFKIAKSKVIENIKNNTYVDDVIINRELPSTLKITIKEKKPHYIIQIANGNAYVDSRGYILEISTESLSLPTLSGYCTSIENIVDFQNTKKLSDEDCKKLEVVNQVMESAKNNNIYSYITGVDIEDISDLKLKLDTEKKIVYLGDCSNANIRLLYLKSIIEQEAGKEGEVFINGDIQTLKPKPYFREKV